MRYVVLDTETTGLSPQEGHRVLEIGCVELVNRRVTTRYFHEYLNPEREVDAGAAAVHGMTWDSLKDKPLFADVVEQFLEFVAGSRVVIHNAAFDVGFLDAELARLNKPKFEHYVDQVIDSLWLARDTFPGKRNSLDALCDRFGISNQHRVLHGALLDSQLLGEVYLALTRGQSALNMNAQESDEENAQWGPMPENLTVIFPTETEQQLHLTTLARTEEKSKRLVWSAPV